MKKPTNSLPQEEALSNAFTQLLNTHRKGLAGHQCSTMLEEAIRASLDTGAKAEINIKVTILPGVEDQVNITIQPTAKLPQQKLPGAFFWVDEGKLVTSVSRDHRAGNPHNFTCTVKGWNLLTEPADFSMFPHAQTALKKV